MIRVFGNWAIVVGTGTIGYSTVGLVTELLAGEPIVPIISVFVVILFSVVVYEVSYFIRASKIWKKVGDDVWIRKVIMCGTPKFLNSWEYNGMAVTSSSYPPIVVFRSVKNKWRHDIAFDSLLTKIIYQRKIDEFIAIRESLS